MNRLANVLIWPWRGFLKPLLPGSRLPAPAEALAEATGWARASTNEAGIPASDYSMIRQAFLPPSVEVCSLWLRFLVRLERTQPGATGPWPGRDTAASLAAWLLAQQRRDGTWPAAGQGPADAAPGVFASGLALHALLDWRAAGHGDETTDAAIGRNASWLVAMQNAGGGWDQYTHGDAAACTYAGYALLRAGAALSLDAEKAGGEKSLAAAARFLAHALTARTGDVMPSASLLWMLLALAEAGRSMGPAEYAAAARLGLPPLQRAVTRQGFLHALVGYRQAETTSYAVPHANCLLALLGNALSAGDAEDPFAALAERSLLFARSHQLQSRDPRLHGGLTGSWPVSGYYKPYAVAGEAVALFATALLGAVEAERRQQEESPAGRAVERPKTSP
jgi:hypothetical protein